MNTTGYFVCQSRLSLSSVYGADAPCTCILHATPSKKYRTTKQAAYSVRSEANLRQRPDRGLPMGRKTTWMGPIALRADPLCDLIGVWRSNT